MWSAVRGRDLSYSSTFPISQRWSNLASSSISSRYFSSSALNCGGVEKSTELLSLTEVEKILKDVQADDVKILQSPKTVKQKQKGAKRMLLLNVVGKMVESVLLSTPVKQKQKGAKRMLLLTVVGQEGWKCIVIDSGKLIVHAVDENCCDRQGLITILRDFGRQKTSNMDVDHYQNAFVSVRRENDSKKRSQPQAHS